MTFRYTFAYIYTLMASRSAKNQCHSISYYMINASLPFQWLWKENEKHKKKERKLVWYTIQTTTTAAATTIKWMPLKQNVWPIFRCVMVANGCVVFKWVCVCLLDLYRPLTRWTCFQFYMWTHKLFSSSSSFVLFFVIRIRFCVCMCRVHSIHSIPCIDVHIFYWPIDIFGTISAKHN